MRTDLPKGKILRNEGNVANFSKVGPLPPDLNHTPRDSFPLLYCLLVEGDLRGEDCGLQSQKDVDWHHSKLPSFLEPQINSSSVKWANNSCYFMSL